MIIGEVTYIDNFGNIISNISKDFFENISKGYNSFTIKFRNLAFQEFSSHTEVVSGLGKETEFHGQSAAIFNDSQLLELTIYKGSKKNGLKACLD
jgi:S-adenosylmethionine hydrolase